MKTVKIGNRTEEFVTQSSNTKYVLADGKAITDADSGIRSHAPLDNVAFEIDGRIHTKYAGITLGSELSWVPGARIEIGETGRIVTGGRGVEVNGDGHRIDNAGTIRSTVGIDTYGDDTVIVNSGRIAGKEGGIYVSGATTIVNSGHVGGEYGVYFHAMEASGGGVLKNTGTIAGDGYAAVTGSFYADRIVNAGRIEGFVDLSSGDDTFIFKKGSVTGEVRGGADNDTFVVKAKGLDIVETAGQGFELVKSSVSFMLGDHIEQLNLTGRKDINGTGNDQDNHLQGNAGANVLRGEDGVDFLGGMGGNDRLFGGAGADVFNFQAGTGRDVVMDFEAGIDEIQLGGLKGAVSFEDFYNNRIAEKGDDLWITYGDDVVILKNTDKEDIIVGDFVF